MASKTPNADTSPTTLMLAYLCIKGLNTLNERVDVLDRFGLTDDQIAAVCQAAAQSVRNARLKNKKAKPSEKPGNKAQPPDVPGR